jgi:hypothetical protein
MEDSVISKLDGRVSELEHSLRRIMSRLDEIARFAANTDRQLEMTDGLVSDLRSANPQAGAISSGRILDEIGESRRNSVSSGETEFPVTAAQAVRTSGLLTRWILRPWCPSCPWW